MPSSVPVPSKGALKALRHLALGTSCTVAVGAGLLTEDRRRRIHTARKIYENAQTLKSLKSSRGYHATIDSFDEEILERGGNAYWLPSKVAKSRTGYTTKPAPELESNAELHTYGSDGANEPVPFEQSNIQHLSYRRQALNCFVEPTSLQPSIFTRSQTASDASRNSAKAEIQERVSREGEARNLDAAVANLVSMIKSAEGAIQPRDLEATIEIFELAEASSREDIQERILTEVSRSGPIDESQFWRFKPEEIMKRMIKRLRIRGANNHPLDEGFLKDIVSIYLTTFHSKPTAVHSNGMHAIGEMLCNETNAAGLYDLTLRVFTRYEQLRGHRPPNAAKYLIKARHALGKHGKLFRPFKLLYQQTQPDQVGFFQTGNCVLEGLLEKGDIKRMEEFLDLATNMAIKGEIKTSTSWFLKTLNYEWNSRQNINEARELFDRIASLISKANHPQALYAAIIQYCVEADKEDAALFYHTQLSKAYPQHSDDVRILAHLTLAKALRGDWVSVKSDLQNICQHSAIDKISDRSEFEALFMPILKVFSASHELVEIERFLEEIVDNCLLQVSTHIFNFMLNLYLKSEDFESLQRWIDFAAAHGNRLDATSVNSFLLAFARGSTISFPETFGFFKQILKLENPFGLKFTDASTFQLLQKVANSKARNPREREQFIGQINSLVQNTSGDVKPPTKVETQAHAMLQAYDEGQFAEVVSLYESAQAENIKLSDHSILLTVKAISNVDGAPEEVRAIIKTAQDDGRDVSVLIATLIDSQLKKLAESTMDSEEILSCVQTTLRTMRDGSINIVPTVLTKVLRLMIETGRADDGARIWNHIASESGLSNSTLDLATLTVLLDTYIAQNQGNAVLWAVETLIENKLEPDVKFWKALKNGLRRSRRATEAEMAFCTPEWLRCLERACDQVRDMRKEMFLSKQQLQGRSLKVMAGSMEREVASKRVNGARKEVWTLQKQQTKLWDGKDEWQNRREPHAYEPKQAQAAAL